jgi:signal transduction histidine kinase
MLKRLKSLDKILLVTFIAIAIVGILSGLAVNRILTNLLFQRSKEQVISSTELLARAAALEMDTGNFRNAWVMIQLNLGRNNFTDFLLLNGEGIPLVSDTQAEAKIFPFWKDGLPLENINLNTKIKKLRTSGDFIAEFKFKNLGNSSGSYSLLLFFSDSELAKVQYKISIYIWSYSIFLIAFMGYLIFFFRIKLLIAINNVNESLESILHGNTYDNKGSVFTEYIQSKQTLEKFTLEFSEVKSKLVDQVKIKTFGNLAQQVAHDIRSPLAALNMVTESITNLPTSERMLMKNAIQRINDIANDLLQKGKQEYSTAEKALTIELMPTLIDIIVSEKRMQFREFSNLTIEVDLTNSFGAFAKINSSEFKRVISNLINNSVEAFLNHAGRVVIGVRKSNNQVEIFVEDNGKGIPSHLIPQLGQEGLSHGKEAKDQSGSGLGLYHAKLAIEKINGKLSIESVENTGTVVRILLPPTETPAWFASSIDLSNKKTLVSLDDDSSIHQIWSSRLQFIDGAKIIHKQFQSGLEFKKYVNENLNNLKNILFLVDFELLNQHKTGLDLIEELNIGQYSILVTSLYEDHHIQQRAKAQGLIILPKSLAGFVPIKAPKLESKKIKYDIVLLDNDPLVCLTWEMKAKRNGKSILVLTSAKVLYEELSEIDYDSIFYIDVHLTESGTADGVQVSKKLYDLGCLNLYLATGYEADKFSHITWIKGVVGKTPAV